MELTRVMQIVIRSLHFVEDDSIIHGNIHHGFNYHCFDNKQKLPSYYSSDELTIYIRGYIIIMHSCTETYHRDDSVE